MTHNEAIDLLLKEYASSDRKRLTELFIQTLSIGRIHFGLQVLSKMKTYYIHSYSKIDTPKTGDLVKDHNLVSKECRKPFHERKYVSFENMDDEARKEIIDNPIYCCGICASFYEKNIEKYPFNPLYGIVDGTDIFHMVQCLQQENRESISFVYNDKQQKEGLSILDEVFETIASVQESDGIRYVYKLLKKKDFFKHWKIEGKCIGVKFYAELALQHLLEIMGYLSILHTEKYRGSFYEFNEGITPRSSRSSDWNYPVDFWRGKNGIDKIAFKYWFGEYDELEKFWKN